MSVEVRVAEDMRGLRVAVQQLLQLLRELEARVQALETDLTTHKGQTVPPAHT